MCMKFFSLLTVLLFVSISSYGLEVKGFTPDESVDYKKVEKGSLKLHFFLPKGFKKNDGSKRPAIVFFFGGGWVG